MKEGKEKRPPPGEVFRTDSRFQKNDVSGWHVVMLGLFCCDGGSVVVIVDFQLGDVCHSLSFFMMLAGEMVHVVMGPSFP